MTITVLSPVMLYFTAIFNFYILKRAYIVHSAGSSETYYSSADNR